MATAHGITMVESNEHVEKLDDYSIDEKKEAIVDIASDSQSEIEEKIDGFVRDPFVPFDDLPDEPQNILTIRALIIGSICGALVNASNIYLGLKTGWTFSANIFGAIVGFAVLKSLSQSNVFNHIPILGGPFGPKENAIVQTAAMAAGGMSSVFVSAVPALYQLGLLDTPNHDYWRLTALTAVGGYFGFFFATPLRKFFIIYVARELRLIFPTPSATAVTIRGMHAAVGGASAAKLKMRALSIAFAGAFSLRVASQYAIGILWDWHVFTWFFIWGHYHNAAINVESWGWLIEWTPAFIGSGMLVGINVALSFFSGSVLAWGIIGPVLVKYGAAFGKPMPTDDPNYAKYYNYFSLSESSSTKLHPSPRYWMLWPGVLCMICVSLVELACQYKVFIHGSRALTRATSSFANDMLAKRGKSSARLARLSERKETDVVQDFAPEKDQVALWMWMPGLLIIAILTCVVTAKSYNMMVGESILALVLAFVFSFLAIQCTGATDVTPLTAASKASQIVLGGVTQGQNIDINDARRLNLIGGAIASIGANQSSDLVSDFRTGFLLRVSPRLQWYAQGICTAVAVFLAPGMYTLFAKAYPCINDQNAETCAFGIPSVTAWRAVAVAMTDPTFPVPNSAGYFAIAWSIFGSIMVLIRHNILIGKRAWMRTYWPNMMVMSLAFVIPQTVYGTATLIGAIISFIWAKRYPKGFDIFAYAIAAGLIAGEGIGGVINAIFQIAGISGDIYGSTVACPAGLC